MPAVTHENICFLAGPVAAARAAHEALTARYGNTEIGNASVIVALGGDGFMLSVLHENRDCGIPVYGMHRGTVGFLMNDYSEDGLHSRLAAAEEAAVNPLTMQATKLDGSVENSLAINEVSLLRQGPQAAKLRILVDGRERMAELVCDGALLSTPAGSTAYNYSAHGPILPIGAEVMALTAVAAYRPRRWRGALLPKAAEVRFEVLDAESRPVAAVADSFEVRNVVSVDIRTETTVTHRLLFDPGHGLEERLIREQFV